ncbi:hypothetical protein SDC9_128689 [bioreactor metagenome]|uniref:Uncharacterized protein n=1 Tax=bioreactor metagenome TaxID=1076179 RepID=A0A645CXN5_9ZZZZ
MQNRYVDGGLLFEIRAVLRSLIGEDDRQHLRLCFRVRRNLEVNRQRAGAVFIDGSKENAARTTGGGNHRAALAAVVELQVRNRLAIRGVGNDESQLNDIPGVDRVLFKLIALNDDLGLALVAGATAGAGAAAGRVDAATVDPNGDVGCAGVALYMERDIVVAFGNAFDKGGGELEVSVLTVRQRVAVPGDKRAGSYIGLLKSFAIHRGLGCVRIDKRELRQIG